MTIFMLPNNGIASSLEGKTIKFSMSTTSSNNDGAHLVDCNMSGSLYFSRNRIFETFGKTDCEGQITPGKRNHGFVYPVNATLRDRIVCGRGMMCRNGTVNDKTIRTTRDIDTYSEINESKVVLVYKDHVEMFFSDGDHATSDSKIETSIALDGNSCKIENYITDYNTQLLSGRCSIINGRSM